jgi:hypothetical protein
MVDRGGIVVAGAAKIAHSRHPTGAPHQAARPMNTSQK